MKQLNIKYNTDIWVLFTYTFFQCHPSGLFVFPITCRQSQTLHSAIVPTMQ